MPAFGILLARLDDGRHQVFTIELVDDARLAHAGSADEGNGVAGLDERGQFLHASLRERAHGEHQRITGHARGFRQLGFRHPLDQSC